MTGSTLELTVSVSVNNILINLCSQSEQPDEVSNSYQGHKHVLTLTHWGRVTHICVSKLSTTGSDNGLSPGRHQAIIWTNAGILLIGPLGTNFSEIFIEIYIFSFKKMHLKMSSGNCRPFCLGLNVLIPIWISSYIHHKNVVYPVSYDFTKGNK